MTKFAVVILTSPPPGQSAEAGSALLKLDGREALLRTAELFLNRENVCQVQLILSAPSSEEIKRKLGVNLGFLGIKVATSASGWSEQLKTSIEKIAAEATHVILHDASRPLVPYGDIDALMSAAESHTAVALTAPVRSSLLELDEGGSGVAIRRATEFVALLHPHAFDKARYSEIPTRAVHPSEFKLIPGSPLNIRLSGSADEKLGKAMLGLLPKPKMRTPNNPFEEAQW